MRRQAVGVLVLAALLLTACAAPQLGDVSPSGVDLAAALASGLLDVSAVTADASGPAWQAPLTGSGRLAVDGGGRYIVTAAKSGTGRLVTAWTANGDTLWQTNSGEVAQLLANRGGAAWLATQGDHGTLATRGWKADHTTVVAIDSAARLEGEGWASVFGLIDSIQGSLTIVTPDGQRMLRVNSANGVAVSFAADGTTLVQNGNQLTLLGGDGRTIWQTTAGAPDLARRMQLSPSGQQIAVATGDDDRTLYTFTAAGQPEWKVALPGSGLPTLRYALDGQQLLVLPVGQGGAAAFDAATGKLLWAHRFVQGDTALKVVAGGIGPDGSLLLLNPVGENMPSFAVRLDASGQLRQVIALTDVQSYATNQNGTVLAVLVGKARAGSTSLQVYDWRQADTQDAP